MLQLLAIVSKKQEFVWWDSFEIMTVNVYFDARQILQLFVLTLCVQLTTQQEKYKNGSAAKFTFEIISSTNCFIEFTSVFW